MVKIDITVEDALRSEGRLVAVLSLLPAKFIAECIDYERKHANRPAILKRLHQRYSKFRTMRERKEIIGDD